MGKKKGSSTNHEPYLVKNYTKKIPASTASRGQVRKHKSRDEKFLN